MPTDFETIWLRSLDARKAILFWSETYKPQDFVGCPHPRSQEAAEILRKPIHRCGYMGFASCRICGERLGTNDFSAHGFVWPEGAEHYILTHGLWIPELDELLAAASR